MYAGDLPDVSNFGGRDCFVAFTPRNDAARLNEKPTAGSSGSGLKSCDVLDMPVICPTRQTFRKGLLEGSA
jgi:hypothetical protein